MTTFSSVFRVRSRSDWFRSRVAAHGPADGVPVRSTCSVAVRFFSRRRETAAARGRAAHFLRGGRDPTANRIITIKKRKKKKKGKNSYCDKYTHGNIIILTADAVTRACRFVEQARSRVFAGRLLIGMPILLNAVVSSSSPLVSSSRARVSVCPRV